ncbi:MAG: LLM class F420-dependent oxidoreductase [Candidatus Rokubacteria bacterium]|nr:LLM class F420-dependent oxidoreductase [Candidatus Rokubacteria bacterium]
MKFGFDLPTRMARLDASERHVNEIVNPHTITALAQKGEALGFDSVWVSDHVVIPATSEGYPYTEDGTYPLHPQRPFLEPLVSLAYLAGCTRRIRLGTSVVILPYRNPVITAKMLATMDVLSAGRLIVGVGIGWWAQEFSALGVPFFRDRGAYSDECVRIFKELWTSELSSFEGKYHSFSSVGCYPKPVQKPHPPIWIGGQTTSTLKRVARLGDGWHPLAMRKPVRLDPGELKDKVAELRRLVEAAGRDPEAIEVSLRIRLRFSDADRGERLTGTVGKVADDIRRYGEAGVSHFLFDLEMDSFQGMAETLERFAVEVRPQLT